MVLRNPLHKHSTPPISMRSYAKRDNSSPHTPSTIPLSSPLTHATPYLHSPQSYNKTTAYFPTELGLHLHGKCSPLDQNRIAVLRNWVCNPTKLQSHPETVFCLHRIWACTRTELITVPWPKLYSCAATAIKPPLPNLSSTTQPHDVDRRVFLAKGSQIFGNQTVPRRPDCRVSKVQAQSYSRKIHFRARLNFRGGSIPIRL